MSHLVKNAPKLGQLMTYEEYEQAEQEFPYFFTLERNGQHLAYFGAEHVYDPDHEQNRKIKKAWEEFFTKAAKENTLVLVEGGIRKAEKDEAGAIKSDGEAGLVTYLATQAGIEVTSPEPPLAYEVSELLQQFSKEEILYDYFARAIDQWYRTDASQDRLVYVRHMISDEAEVLGITENILSVLTDTHQKIFGTAFNLEDAEHFKKACDPANIASVVNQVARASSILRDTYILKQIRKHWQTGKNLFIVYGATHAIMQEPALREMTKKS